MNSNFFKLNAKDIAGAVLSAVIVAVLGYLSTLTNIFDADFTQILNISVLTAITSLLKSLGTDGNGSFLGSIKVK
jgi:5,10-methenyltetrahydromethanopterin hydrogenase